MDDLVVDGDSIEFHWTFTGTITGTGGTGKAVRVSGFEEWTIMNEGMLAARTVPSRSRVAWPAVFMPAHTDPSRHPNPIG